MGPFPCSKVGCRTGRAPDLRRVTCFMQVRERDLPPARALMGARKRPQEFVGRNVRSERLRVAVLAPPWFAVPPRRYGGTEAVVSLLVDGLVRRRHEVTLFASGDSRTQASLVSAFAQSRTDDL